MFDEFKKKVVPIILAGGYGKRLWPISRRTNPKQFLKVFSSKSTFQQTIERLKGLDFCDPIVVCGDDHRFLVAEQLDEIKVKGRILVEPLSRNTAAPIAIASLLVEKDKYLLVLSSDHFIENIEYFKKALANALMLSRNEKIVSLGVMPNSPKSNFGYIKLGEKYENGFYIKNFVEKPKKSSALAFLRGGNYVWNSGIFMTKQSILIDELKYFLSDLYQSCQRISKTLKRDLSFERIDKLELSKCPHISIDYALMEKTKRSAVVILDTKWSDLGTWGSVDEISTKDRSQNFKAGRSVEKYTKNTFVLSSGDRLVATLGLSNTIVVDTKDALLVASKNYMDKFPELCSAVEGCSSEYFDESSVVLRPWGNYEVLCQDPNYKVKKITIKPSGKLSLQRHKFRSEHWTVVSGTAKVIRGKKIIKLKQNQTIYIPKGMVHSIENIGKRVLQIIEVQTGSYFGEDDIERLEDVYGRNSDPIVPKN